jgi:protein-tyrosine-phosphatase
MSELARSDLRVSELCDRLGMPQSLVSYHLRRLEGERLVTRRRSAADARASYCTLDLDRCRELLAEAGAALHAGLRLAQAEPLTQRVGPSENPIRVLFLCTGNSARSQIAQVLAGRLGGGAVEAHSAGSHPKPLHSNALRVMRERELSIVHLRSKSLSEFSGERFDYVVTLCDRVREVCPEFPGHPYAIHWSIPDPAREGDTDEGSYPAFERTASELERRIRYLLELILTEHDQLPRRAHG